MNAKNLIGGLLAGAAIGAAIGLLLAPGSGEETRGKLAKGTKKLKDGVKESVEDSIDSVKSKFNYGMEEFEKKGKGMTDGKRI